MNFNRIYLTLIAILIFGGCDENRQVEKTDIQSPYKEVFYWEYSNAAEKFEAIPNPTQLERYKFALISIAYAETELGEKPRHKDKEVASRGVIGLTNTLKNKVSESSEKAEIVAKYQETKQYALNFGLNSLKKLAREGHPQSIVSLANHYTFKNNKAQSYFWLKAVQFADLGGGLFFDENNNLTSETRPILRFTASVDEELNFFEGSMSTEQIAEQKNAVINSIATGLICESKDSDFSQFGFRKIGHVFSPVVFKQINNELTFSIADRKSKWIEEIDQYKNAGETINRRTLEYRYIPTATEIAYDKQLHRIENAKSDGAVAWTPPKSIYAKCSYYSDYGSFAVALDQIVERHQNDMNKNLQLNKF